ncbi:MAG: TonB-dependent receptor [Ignavibacteria bacterium]
MTTILQYFTGKAKAGASFLLITCVVLLIIENDTAAWESGCNPGDLSVAQGIGNKDFKPEQVSLIKSEIPAEKTGVVKGVIKDERGRALSGASIVVVHTNSGGTTDLNGRYVVNNIKPGSYKLKVTFVSYELVERDITIEPGETPEVNFILKPAAFLIGGIEVLGKSDLLPADIATKTIISGGEIEHYQASSVKDILYLAPGIQKTDNPGLDKSGQATIRGREDDRLSAFGTLIVVDGIPMSNNANMQFEKMTNSTTGVSNMGAGIDIRTIPADNIESIEVIAGLPSVRYGDATEGVINIRTKSGYQPNRLKIKQNPDTKEANLGGGFLSGRNGLNYNLNYALSERDIRKTGDEFSRLTGQVMLTNSFYDNRLVMNHKFSGQQIFDNEEPKGDAYQTKNYNKSFSLGYSGVGKYVFEDGVSGFDYNVYINLRNENSMRSKLVQAEVHITPAGDTVSAYIGKVETKGKEWTAGSRLEWNNLLFTGDIVHKLMFGMDIQYNANTGKGVLVDSVYNYYGYDSGRRSYTFDELPGQILAGLYVEDKITWHFLFDFNLMPGLRYEMYRPFQFSLKGLWGDGDIVNSHQGTFFNPRLSLMVYFSKVNQLRISAGVTSKSPSMNTVFPRPDVYKFRDPVLLKNIYFYFDQGVPDLKGSREEQYEISYDHKLFNLVGASLTAYYRERRQEAQSQSVPNFYIVQSDLINRVYYSNSFSRYQNTGWTIFKGIEFTLRTNNIKPLNMSFELNGAYSFSNASTNGISYDFTPDLTKGQIPNYKIPGSPVDTVLGFIYTPGDKRYERFQLNYYLKYILPSLGLWLTLRAEQLLIDKYQDYNQEPENYSMLTDDGKLTYNFNREVKSKGVKWLFNLNISKSLFKGAEVSFYVNNFPDNPAISLYYVSPYVQAEEIRNPPLFYGIEFSCVLDNLFRRDEL